MNPGKRDSPDNPRCLHLVLNAALGIVVAGTVVPQQGVYPSAITQQGVYSIAITQQGVYDLIDLVTTWYISAAIVVSGYIAELHLNCYQGERFIWQGQGQNCSNCYHAADPAPLPPKGFLPTAISRQKLYCCQGAIRVRVIRFTRYSPLRLLEVFVRLTVLTFLRKVTIGFTTGRSFNVVTTLLTSLREICLYAGDSIQCSYTQYKTSTRPYVY